MRLTATHLAGRSFRLATIGTLALLVGVPLVFIILQAIFPDLGSGHLSDPFSKLLPALSDPQLLHLAFNTILLGVCVAVGAAIIGVPLGIARALMPIPFAAMWDVLLLTPFMIPPYIATLGWIMVLQPRGYLQQVVGVNAGPFLFSFGGLVFVMAVHFFPVVYFATSRSVAASGSHLANVARIFGASPLTAFRRVILPLALPAMTGSMLLVFASSIEEYGTPAALASQNGFDVLVTAIDHRVADFPVDLSGASSLSLVLVTLALAAFWLQRRFIAGRSYETIGGKPQRASDTQRGWGVVAAMAAIILVAIIAIGLPMFGILAAAFSRTFSGGLEASNLSIRNFQMIFADANGATSAMTLSLLLGAATALLTAVVGIAAALAMQSRHKAGGGLIGALTALPNSVPGIVVAVGLILAWNQPWLPVSFYGTSVMLLLAYSCILLPYPVRYIGAALTQIGSNLQPAARVAGAGHFTAFRRIILPLLRPSLIAAMMLVFAIAMRELVASTLLVPVGSQTISTFIWRQFEQGSLGLGMAMSAVAMLVTTTIMLVTTVLTQRALD